jgi:hypothetical protein
MLDINNSRQENKGASMKLYFGVVVSVCSFFLFTCLMICGETAWGGTKTGTARSSDELQQAVSKWKFHMANTAHKQDKTFRETVKTKRARGESDTVTKKYKVRGTTYGTFFWCPVKGSKNTYRYSYTYGEADPEMATTKAAHAFDAEGRDCAQSPKILRINSDQL